MKVLEWAPASRHRRRSLTALVGLVSVLCLTASAARGQGLQTGALAGTVFHALGDPLPGVTVTVTSDVLLGERMVATGVNGDFVIRGLPPGLYRVVFRLEGVTAVEREVRVELGRTSRADASLELAAVEELLEVVADTPSVLDNTTGGANLTHEQVDVLPIAREPMAVANLAPGTSDRTLERGQLSLSGGLAYDNLIMVDGVDIGFFIFGNTSGPFREEVGLFIEEAIAETQVLTSALSAEYGRFAGGVINAVTKQGSNRFEGSLRADLTDPGWRDETPFEEERGIRRRSDLNALYSATLGGRVVRDRLWFFLAAAAADASSPALYPVTGLPRPDDFVNRRYEAKLTESIAGRHTLEALALGNDSDLFQSPVPDSIDPRTADRFSLLHDHRVLRYGGVWGRSLLGELRYSEREFEPDRFGGTSADLRDAPFATLTQENATYNGVPFDESDPIIEFSDQQVAGSLSTFFATGRAGSHDLKAGFELFTSTQLGGLSVSPSGIIFFADYETDETGRAILDPAGRLRPLFRPFGALALLRVPDRGARLEIDTTSYFVHDVWRLDDRWSLHVGLRYEQVEGRASDGSRFDAADTLAPRLAVAVDPRGDGRFKLGASYAEYAGRYQQELFKRGSSSRNPSDVLFLYAGPPGAGVGFGPGFDLSNYFPIAVNLPANTSLEAGLSSPVSEEITLSAAMGLGPRGDLELNLVERDLTGAVEDFITLDNGRTLADSPVGPVLLDNVVLRNSGLSVRRYRALQVQGRYQPNQEWSLEGQWTHQLDHEGNYEGSAPVAPGVASAIGDYPEILVEDRNEPRGRLRDFQRHKVRLWALKAWELGRVGSLDLGLLLRYDSARTFSLVASNVPVTPVQLARDPGYAQPPQFQRAYFGARGSGEFEDERALDLSLRHSIPVGRSRELWTRLEVRNVFNEDALVGWDTGVQPDFGGPLDGHGIPTDFVPGPSFGRPRSPEDFMTPRELRLSIGFRF